VGFGWEGDADGVAWGDVAAGEDDGHDAGAGLFFGCGRREEAGLHEAGFAAGVELVDLVAGAAEAGDFKNDCRADVEEGPGGEADEVEVAGGDVFAHLAGGEGKLVEEFGLEEVDLAEVGLGGVFALEVEVLGEGAGVGVAFYAVLGDEVNL